MIADLQLTIHLPQSQSLKQKRSIIKSLKERLKNAFNVSVAEVGSMDKWQICELDIVMVSSDHQHLQGQFEKINAFVDGILAANGYVTSRELNFY